MELESTNASVTNVRASANFERVQACETTDLLDFRTSRAYSNSHSRVFYRQAERTCLITQATSSRDGSREEVHATFIPKHKSIPICCNSGIMLQDQCHEHLSIVLPTTPLCKITAALLQLVRLGRISTSSSSSSLLSSVGSAKTPSRPRTSFASTA